MSRKVFVFSLNPVTVHPNLPVLSGTGGTPRDGQPRAWGGMPAAFFRLRQGSGSRVEQRANTNPGPAGKGAGRIAGGRWRGPVRLPMLSFKPRPHPRNRVTPRQVWWSMRQEMTEDSVSPSRIRRGDTGIEGRLERHLLHPPALVWQMLTEPQGIAQWLAPGSIELRKGGRVHVDFGDSGVVIDSTVLELEPLRRLAFSWSSGNEPERPLHWSLTATDAGTDLALTVCLPEGEDLAKACAGFDAHLEMLAAALEGVPIRFPFELYLARRRAWQEALAQ